MALFKIVLIQHIYRISSLRLTPEEMSMNLAYRWFIGYPPNESVPHFSTVSYNFKHRLNHATVVCIPLGAESSCGGRLSGHRGIPSGRMFTMTISRNTARCIIPPQTVDGYREYKSRAYFCKNCHARVQRTENAKCEKQFCVMSGRTMWRWRIISGTWGCTRNCIGYEKRKSNLCLPTQKNHGMHYTTYRGSLR